MQVQNFAGTPGLYGKGCFDWHNSRVRARRHRMVIPRSQPPSIVGKRTMYLLNHYQIMGYLERPAGQKLDIEPFEEANLQHTSYYYRLGRYYWRRHARDDREVMVLEGRDPYLDVIGDLEQDASSSLTLLPNEYVVVETMEHFKLDETIFAIFGGVSEAALRGVEVVNSPFIDPLFPSRSRSEPLKIGLRNLNPDSATIRLGTAIGKIAFFDVSDTYPVQLRSGSSHAERFGVDPQ